MYVQMWMCCICLCACACVCRSTLSVICALSTLFCETGSLVEPRTQHSPGWPVSRSWRSSCLHCPGAEVTGKRLPHFPLHMGTRDGTQAFVLAQQVFYLPTNTPVTYFCKEE